MSSLVLIDTDSGSLTRLETGGECYRKTHYAVPKGGAEALTPSLVEGFRVHPSQDFSLDPPPRPTNPPAAAGRVMVAA